MRQAFKTDQRMVKVREPGVRMERDGIRFTVMAPEGEQVSLLLYCKEKGTLEAELPFPAEEMPGRFRSMKVHDLDWQKYRYRYRIGNQVTVDGYARCIWREKGEELPLCELEFSHFSWGKSEKPRIPYRRGIMYHLHVRNYTMHEKSGVSHRGTFLGLKEKIPYLKKLGVNQIILMPVYDFDEEKKNYWGYKSGFYYAPKRSYAATKDPVLEFKTMVKAFHEHQMEVIPEFYFSADTVLREQIEILRYWMEEYQIDGFRIMGDTDLAGHLAGDPLFADCKILSYYCGDLDKDRLQNYNMAEMNDGFLNDMRRSLKGDEGMLEAMAFRTRRNPSGYGVINYITGHDGFTLQDLFSYDQKHNEENGEQNRDGCQCNYSWNCGIEGETRKRTVLTLRNQMKKNAMMMLLFSQGTPMILAGDEFGNSQKGNNNPYCLDNEVSWVDWDAYRKNLKFFRFVKALIAMRKSEELFHMEKEFSFTDQKACGYPDFSYHGTKAWYGDFSYANRHLGMLYCGNYAEEEKFLYLLCNFHSQEEELALPKLPQKMRWMKKIDTSLGESILPEAESLKLKEKTIKVPERSLMLLIGEQE